MLLRSIVPHREGERSRENRRGRNLVMKSSVQWCKMHVFLHIPHVRASFRSGLSGWALTACTIQTTCTIQQADKQTSRQPHKQTTTQTDNVHRMAHGNKSLAAEHQRLHRAYRYAEGVSLTMIPRRRG